MKKLIVTLIAVAAVVSAYGQGKVTFGNTVAGTASADLIQLQQGESTVLLPNRVSGATQFYMFGLFMGYSSDPTAMNLVGYGTNSISTAGGFGAPVPNVLTTTNTVNPGWLNPTQPEVFYQVRGWTAGVDGKYLWADIKPIVDDKSNPLVAYGESAIQKVNVVFGNTPANNVFAIGTATEPLAYGGVNGFTLVPVPEPSTFALMGLGLAGLYFIRRRK